MLQHIEIRIATPGSRFKEATTILTQRDTLLLELLGMISDRNCGGFAQRAGNT